jgi:hypothetical protein
MCACVLITEGKPVFSTFSALKCERKRLAIRKGKNTVINLGTVEVKYKWLVHSTEQSYT